jgi:hypothetical protein
VGRARTAAFRAATTDARIRRWRRINKKVRRKKPVGRARTAAFRAVTTDAEAQRAGPLRPPTQQHQQMWSRQTIVTISFHYQCSPRGAFSLHYHYCRRLCPYSPQAGRRTAAQHGQTPRPRRRRPPRQSCHRSPRC